jgi:hypothetical protein
MSLKFTFQAWVYLRQKKLWCAWNGGKKEEGKKITETYK